MPTRPLTITHVDFWPVQQPHDKQSYLVIRIATDASIDGWGEVAVSDPVSAAVQRLEVCRKDLVGQDALRLEHLRQMLLDKWKGEYRESAAILAGINMAQFDILGKSSKARAYEVLGGPTRNKARALAPLTGSSEAELLTSLTQVRQAGFRAVRVPLNLPAGPVRGRGFFDRTRQLLDRLRQASNGEVDFVLDCAGRTTHAEASSLASTVEDFHLLWLDEPLTRIQHKALSGLADESATPIGWGRDAVANSEFQDLLRQDAIDVLRPDIAVFGITSIRKAAALAETYYVAVAPRHHGGPLGTAAALHIAASIPNFYIQEVPFPAHEADRTMRRELVGDIESPTDGFFSLPSRPGLGITVNEDALMKYRVKV